MGKRSKILRLKEKIMLDIYDINLLLNLIASDKLEKFAEIMTLADIALEKRKRICINNEKIGKILIK
jgi:hypothetical protein